MNRNLYLKQGSWFSINPESCSSLSKMLISISSQKLMNNCCSPLDPNPQVDVEVLNRQYMERSEELYDSLMDCHWQPLDSVTSEVPVMNGYWLSETSILRDFSTKTCLFYCALSKFFLHCSPFIWNFNPAGKMFLFMRVHHLCVS